MKKVIDTSAWNGPVNWASAKSQGVSGAILKIIRKDLAYDKQFLASQKDCEKIGMPWGVYNYSYATTVSKAKSDMKLICDKLDSLSKKYFTMGVWFDLEDSCQEKLSKSTIADILNAAKEVVESRGYQFGVYTGLAFYKAHIDTTKVKCKNWWIARYYNGYNDMSIKQDPNEKYKPLSNCWAWQYTSSGTFSPEISTGNDKKVDVNVVYQSFETKKEEVKTMTVKIGSARINEKGGINGGKAGDQTGGEVATQNWYKHSKGWVVIRPNNLTDAEKIARCMEMMCANNNIGYCQNHRLTAYNEGKKYNFDMSKVTKKVEVDCSEAVRICCAYAGITLPDFNTASEKTVCKNSGKFTILTDSKYCDSSNYLKRGDILVTKTKGHTVVVLNNGSKAGATTTNQTVSKNSKCPYNASTSTLKKGFKGEGVRWLQWHLNRLIECGILKGKKLVVDGEWGAKTEELFRLFQSAYPSTGTNNKPDGQCGKNSRAKLQALVK